MKILNILCHVWYLMTKSLFGIESLFKVDLYLDWLFNRKQL